MAGRAAAKYLAKATVVMYVVTSQGAEPVGLFVCIPVRRFNFACSIG